jgi:hypothetical protein
MFPRGKGGRCVGLTTLPPSCADCLEIWEPVSWNTQGLSRPVMGLLYLYLYPLYIPTVYCILGKILRFFFKFTYSGYRQMSERGFYKALITTTYVTALSDDQDECNVTLQ